MASAPEYREFLIRGTLIVGLSTLILTASFVGVVALFSGEAVAIGDRFPYYLILMGLVFVGTILLLEEHGSEPRITMLTASISGLLTLLLSVLGVEGILYTYHNPMVIDQRVVYYFIAAALIATGVTYWAIKHWRELVGSGRGGL
jgi:hypothetical protein